jgi:hypothetical protein
LLRVTGHSRFEAEQHIVEQLRCNACQQIYKAPLPESVLEDGDGTQMYGHSARTLMAIDKFFSGVPYYHQGNLAHIFGHVISASTLFDQQGGFRSDRQDRSSERNSQSQNESRGARKAMSYPLAKNKGSAKKAERTKK